MRKPVHARVNKLRALAASISVAFLATAVSCLDSGSGPKAHKLSVQVLGQGSVVSDPDGIDCGTSCTASFAHGRSVRLMARPSDGWEFLGWSGQCSGTQSCSISMSNARSVTARFGVQQKALSVSFSGSGGGTVRSAPTGIDNCTSSCSAPFSYGQTVTLTATPDSESSFSGWSREGCSGQGQCTVLMTDARYVTAHFDVLMFRLDVRKTGDGDGTVRNRGFACGPFCYIEYPIRHQVTLTATPDPGSEFTGWSGAGCSGTGPCEFLMDGPYTVTANFEILDEGPSSCTLPWGGTIRDGESVTAYQSASVPCGSSCRSQLRTCNDGTLSGSYAHRSCSVDPCRSSCTLPWGGTIGHGESVTAYQSASVPCGSSCRSQLRTCNDGTLSGSYTHPSCTTVPTYTVSGMVHGYDGEGLGGVTISFSGRYIPSLTNHNGIWLSSELCGRVTVTPQKDGYGFSPPQQTVSSAGTVDFRGLLRGSPKYPADISALVDEMRDPTPLTVYRLVTLRYGNWCGQGWGGSGDPVDQLDEACREHDLQYAAADTRWQPEYESISRLNPVGRARACDDWKQAYRSADRALADRIRTLSRLDTASMPDTWGYDPRVYSLSSHPLTVEDRNSLAQLFRWFFDSDEAWGIREWAQLYSDLVYRGMGGLPQCSQTGLKPVAPGARPED